MNVPRLERAFQALLSRHQSLRLHVTPLPTSASSISSRLVHSILSHYSSPNSPSIISRSFLPQMLRRLPTVLPSCIHQVDQDPTLVPFRLHQVQVTPPQGSRDWTLRLALEEAREPFSLESSLGLLFRATLIHVGSQYSLLVLTFSPLIFDPLSAPQFYRELQEEYNTVSSEDHSLPNSDIPGVPSYEEYVEWEKEEIKGGKDMAHWVNLIGKDPQPLGLKGRYSPRSVGALPWRGSCVEVGLDQPIRASLENVARQLGASLDVALLTSFSLLLNIWTGQTRVLVGTYVPRRPIGSHCRMIGRMQDVVPIAADFTGKNSDSPNPKSLQSQKTPAFAFPDTENLSKAVNDLGLAFPEVLIQIRNRVAESLDFPSVTLTSLSGELLSHFDLGRGTLIQALFGFTQPGVDSSPLQLNLENSVVELDVDASWEKYGEVARYPLEMVLREEKDGSIKGRLVYQADVLDRPMVEAMAVQFNLVVQAASKALQVGS